MTHLQRAPQTCLKVSEAGLEPATIVRYMLYKILNTSLVPKLYIFVSALEDTSYRDRCKKLRRRERGKCCCWPIGCGTTAEKGVRGIRI